MTAEAELTRSLGIRFIDARLLVSEAKLAEGIVGYATKDQIPLIVERAADLFDAKSDEEKAQMRQMHDDLESVKTSRHSSASRGRLEDDASIATVDSTNSFSSMRNSSGLFRKVVSLGGIGRSNNSMNTLQKNALTKVPMRNAVFSDNSMSPAQENPLLKKVGSAGLISKGMRLRSAGLVSTIDKRNRMARIDRLGSILDIQLPSNGNLGDALECIKSGRDWGEA